MEANKKIGTEKGSKSAKVGVSAKSSAKPCNDVNCPFHGSLKTRGQIFEGVVTSAKMQRSATVEWPYLYYLPKYERYEKRRTRVKVHVPDCISVKVGDKVKIAECRPISKTISFVIIENLSQGSRSSP